MLVISYLLVPITKLSWIEFLQIKKIDSPRWPIRLSRSESMSRLGGQTPAVDTENSPKSHQGDFGTANCRHQRATAEQHAGRSGGETETAASEKRESQPAGWFSGRRSVHPRGLSYASV